MTHRVKWVVQHRSLLSLLCGNCIMPASPPPTAVSSSMACSVPEACFGDRWSNTHFDKDLHYIKGEEEKKQDRHLEMQECCWPKGAKKVINVLPFL